MADVLIHINYRVSKEDKETKLSLNYQICWSPIQATRCQGVQIGQ